MDNGELVRRIVALENKLERFGTLEYATIGGIHTSSFIVDNLASLTDTSTHTTGDVRGSYGVPLYAAGIFAIVYAQADAIDANLYVDSADDTPDVYSSRLSIVVANEHHANFCMVRLGLSTGAASGKIKLKATAATFSNIYLYPVGYWA